MDRKKERKKERKNTIRVKKKRMLDIRNKKEKKRKNKNTIGKEIRK